MKTWLYRRLNHEAKAWPYHVGNRQAQRQSIKRDLETIRAARAWPYAHVSIGHGGNTLYTKDSTLSGFGQYDADTFMLCGIPVINLLTADFSALTKQVISGPMVTQDGRIDDDAGPFNYRPLVDIAKARQSIGAQVFNLDLD